MKNKIQQLKRDIAFAKKMMDCKIQNAMLKGYDIDVYDMKADIEKKMMELAELTKK